MDPWSTWAIGAAFGTISALVGAIYAAGQRRDDKQDARFDQNEQAFDRHLEISAQATERLRAAETEIANLKAEVNALRGYVARSEFQNRERGPFR